VVWNPSPEERQARIDWSQWYLTDEDDMGESGEQEQIIWELKQILTQLKDERRWHHLHIGSDQFFAWVEAEPLVRVSPDVYLLDEVPEPPLPASFQTWLPGHEAPRLALEIVSDDSWAKDYRDNPLKYAQLGVKELIIFDPEAASGKTKVKGRVALQVFRLEADGSFERAESGNGPVKSRELEAFFVVRQVGAASRLAISRDPEGTDLVPTIEEARASERAAKERERKAKERERAARIEAERMQALERKAKLEAEQRIAELMAELERQRKEG
jgi:Uma2 family endonuclease